MPDQRLIAHLRAALEIAEKGAPVVAPPRLLIDRLYPNPDTYSARPAGFKIEGIVIHCTSVSPEKKGYLSAQNHFNNNNGVSIHWIVAASGAILSSVHEHEKAWHCGLTEKERIEFPPLWDKVRAPNTDENAITIGIEFVAAGDADWTDAQYEYGGVLIAGIWRRWGRVPLIPHNWIKRTRACPGRGDVARLEREAAKWMEARDA